ncbi:immune inhibitor A domain-containing protein [Chengkuizengella marina]|uniref:M6 family metalloprotease domain-containing protein n=1 Tax=Chengkuizengella marina TaxID=2507566 RepID=A0A6N9Q6E9_9BACL|nr:immune inhibitor A domain-containing protein [Chengkuizengella marina]NBI30417.1 M6 family metalloprotease domain-containing protein [Chengkuizengella marina]
MLKKKLFPLCMSMALGFSIFAGSVSPGVIATDVQDLHSTSGAFDMSIADDERLIEMLKDNGTIPEGASSSEAQKALSSYLSKRSQAAKDQAGELDEFEKKRNATLKNKASKNGLLNGKGNKLGQQVHVDPVELETWDGEQRKDNVLILLIDFPDFPHNNIQPEETDMYYEDYSVEHFTNMAFGDNGYVGPNGETLISMKQLYEQQSGGSYTIDGQVAGWYTAKNNAAFYGGNNANGNDSNPRELIREALLAASEDPTIDLKEYDQEDRYDLDGDGDLREPDGLVDHLMIVHASVGEEAGGGSLGEDAIWSHRWNLGGVFTMPDTDADAPYWGGLMAAYDYTIQPETGATGVFAHEYAHDLGLPDEYDIQYTGQGEPVSYWSIMSSGSWAGLVPGTEPTGFSPWAKEFLQATMGGNWLTGTTFHIDDIDENGVEVLLDQASSKGTNDDAVRIDLPNKKVTFNEPFSGEFEFFSGKGDELNNSMTTSLDLTSASSASLNFKTWYQIELDWDYASIQVREEGTNEWVSVPGNLTTEYDPNEQNPGFGITGHSDGWVDGVFDLSEFAGKSIDLRFNYWTDVAYIDPGFYVDDISIEVDGEVVLFDDAEGDTSFELDGFDVNDGTNEYKHYYLLEWRNYDGVDEGLSHIRRGDSVMKFEPGLLIWYADESFDANLVGNHPGDGFLGVVDADQHVVNFSDNTPAITRYQVHDATFGLQKDEKMFLELSDGTIKDNQTKVHPMFDDSESYISSQIPDAGRNVPEHGLKIRVIGESDDLSAAKIIIFRD